MENDGYEGVSEWQELLKLIVQEPRYKQRIIDQLGIKPITITRWIEGRAEPRPQNLRQLVNIFPEFRGNFYELLGEDFTEAAIMDAHDASKVIPGAFFARIMSERTKMQQPFRFQVLSYLIFQQAIGQLDPERYGMAITVAQCMKSRHSPAIRSLRESVAYGTAPWQSNLEQKGMFLGAESLAGYCVTSCRAVENNDVRDSSSPLPAHQIPDELSAAAHPILLSGKVAGCLLVSSTQPNYFLSQFRLNLIHNYANLISVLFEAEQFFDLSEIRLHVMPPQDQQIEHFGDFRRRVMDTMITQNVPHEEAEQRMWEELEEYFLAFSQ